MNNQVVKWQSTVINEDCCVESTRFIACNASYAGELLTHSAHIIQAMYKMREFVDDLILSITTSGSMREIDFENAKLMEFLDGFDNFQEETRELTANILGDEYGEEEKESEE